MDGETSSIDGGVIRGCHPRMEKPYPWMTYTDEDDRNGRSQYVLVNCRGCNRFSTHATNSKSGCTLLPTTYSMNHKKAISSKQIFSKNSSS